MAPSHHHHHHHKEPKSLLIIPDETIDIAIEQLIRTKISRRDLAKAMNLLREDFEVMKDNWNSTIAPHDEHSSEHEVEDRDENCREDHDSRPSEHTIDVNL